MGERIFLSAITFQFPYIYNKRNDIQSDNGHFLTHHTSRNRIAHSPISVVYQDYTKTQPIFYAVISGFQVIEEILCRLK